MKSSEPSHSLYTPITPPKTCPIAEINALSFWKLLFELVARLFRIPVSDPGSGRTYEQFRVQAIALTERRDSKCAGHFTRTSGAKLAMVRSMSSVETRLTFSTEACYVRTADEESNRCF